MLYEKFVDRVGRERYRRACDAASRTAASTGKAVDAQDEWPDDLADVPHDLADVWFEPGPTLDDRLDVALRFLAEMPCYANTMYMTGFYPEMTSALRARLWSAYRDALEGPDDGLAGAVAYSLWVDYFEDQTTSADAFAAVTSPGGDWDRRIARVLAVAGPAPWPLKARLFDEIIPHQRWHAGVLEAVLGSLFDLYGRAEPDVAAVLQRLELPGSRADISRARDAAARLPGALR